MLSVEDLTVKYGSFTALDAISFDVDEGQWLMVAGPNGAGKSTIVSAVSQGVPYGGQIRFNGTDLSRMRSKLIARHIAILMQNHSVGYSFTVKEITMLGRYAYREAMSGFTKADEEAVQRALEQTGMAEYANKSVLALSGGELQRVFLAQVFAQDPKLLILDEPANHLDLIYQKQIFGIIKEWLCQEGRAVISVVHELSLARAYGTHALLMDKGRIVSHGEINNVLTAENLETVYSMDVYAYMRQLLELWR